jgi:hypothetical protein
LSSQTTDTPGTTKPHTRGQDRSGATFQTYPINRIFANQRFRDFRSKSRPHPAQGTLRSAPFSRLLSRGSASAILSSRLSHSRRLRRHYTSISSGTNPPQHHPKPPQTQAKHRPNTTIATPKQPKPAKTSPREARHKTRPTTNPTQRA